VIKVFIDPKRLFIKRLDKVCFMRGKTVGNNIVFAAILKEFIDKMRSMFIK
jgi:hypothetical protein